MGAANNNCSEFRPMFIRELLFALRRLWKSKGLTATAALTLAIGIGTATIMFSAVDSILLEPYTYVGADRYTRFFIHDVSRPNEWGRGGFSAPELMDFQTQNHVFEDLMGYVPISVLYSRGGGSEQYDGAWVTGNSFEFHGVEPFLGRWITSDDARPGSPPVFVMSYRLWREKFGGDPGIVGTSFVLNGTPMTLVGIMPDRFLVGDRDIWMPIALTHSDMVNSQSGVPLHFITRGRLKRGVTLRDAAADLTVIANRLSQIYPKDYPKQFTVLTKSLLDTDVGDFRGTLYALMAAVFLLLLIACSNVASLLLVRATARGRELAIRTALGSSRMRLVGQFLIESFVLSFVACILGGFLAYFGLKILVAALPAGSGTGVPINAVFVLNSRALLFAIATSILAMLLCGSVPALRSMRRELSSQLTGAGKGSSSGSRHGRLRSALVVTEVALSLILLTGTGLMLRTMLALEHTELGFNPRNVLYAEVPMPAGRYTTVEGKKIFYQQLLSHIEALPGVVAAAVTVSFPPFGSFESEITIPGKTHSETSYSMLDWCSESYFRTLGIPQIRGRSLAQADVDSARHVVVVNEQLARTYFKGEDPIGRSLRFTILDQVPDAPHDAYFEIIGVVGDIKNAGLRTPVMPQAFAPYTVSGAFDRALIVRTTGDPLRILPSVRSEIWAIDPNVALTSSGTLESYLERFSYAQPKFSAFTFGTFAVIGLLLVIIGVFSVMAQAVLLQTHEIGIRMALGAQRTHIAIMILKYGGVLIGAGIVCGVVASLGLARLLASQIFGISTYDPLTFAAVAGVIAIIGIGACLLPALGAARVDPAIALRYE
jgi:putative ABC transport system permease protein